MAFVKVELTEQEQKALGGRFWKPTAIGDKLTGFFEGYTSRVKDFGNGEGPKTLHSYTFRNKDGDVTHDANPDLHAKLQKAMRPADQGGQGLKAGAGHVCQIAYTHNVPIQGQANPMKGFTLAVDTDYKAPGGAAAPAPRVERVAPKPAEVHRYQDPQDSDDIPF